MRSDGADAAQARARERCVGLRRPIEAAPQPQGVAAAWAARTSGHEDGDESEQENHQAAKQRDDHRCRVHDVLDRVVGMGLLVGHAVSSMGG